MKQTDLVDLQKLDYYKTVIDVIEKLDASGLLERGNGHCLSMSDMIQKILIQKGVDCELVECSLMITIKDPPSMALIGYDGMSAGVIDYSGKMDNHVVCITRTPVPLLIDASLKNVDTKVPYVCVPVTGRDSHTNMVEYDFGSSVWAYQKKLNSQLPVLHQKSILQRINKDREIDGKIGLLTKIVIGFGLISTLNFARGIYDFYLSFVLPNHVPTHIHNQK